MGATLRTEEPNPKMVARSGGKPETWKVATQPRHPVSRAAEIAAILTVMLAGAAGRETAPADQDLGRLMAVRENLIVATNVTPYLKSPWDETPKPVAGRWPWKERIKTTVFWVGERPTENNPVPNNKSSWDGQWESNYGGYDSPRNRIGFRPAGFIPKQNPFYIALPYNDIGPGGTKPEASKVIPWFRPEFKGPGQSVVKGRWVAIRHKGRVCYAQWEDSGPFRTDHWAYVFGNARPSPNRNGAAGLDVSPAVRDYLGLGSGSITDWKFADLQEVPRGPWSKYGENNPFSPQFRQKREMLAANNLKKIGSLPKEIQGKQNYD